MYGWFAHRWCELCLSLVKVEKILDLHRWHHGGVIALSAFGMITQLYFWLRWEHITVTSGVFSSGQTRRKTGDDLGKPGEKKIANTICVLVFENLWKFFWVWVFFFKEKPFSSRILRTFTGNFMHIFQNKYSLRVLPKFLGIGIDRLGQIYLNSYKLLKFRKFVSLIEVPYWQKVRTFDKTNLICSPAWFYGILRALPASPS